LQADTQTTVTMLCLVDLHVLNKKNKIKIKKKRWHNKKTFKNVKSDKNKKT